MDQDSIMKNRMLNQSFVFLFLFGKERNNQRIKNLLRKNAIKNGQISLLYTKKRNLSIWINSSKTSRSANIKLGMIDHHCRMSVKEGW